MKNLIIAPHGDDEIIGCYTVLSESQKNSHVIFIDYETHVNEIRQSSKYFKFSFELKSNFCEKFNFKNCCGKNVYVPDPFCESNSLHRRVGMLVYAFWLENPIFFLNFYTTQMNSFYVQTLSIKNRNNKKLLLNNLYPLQKDLWLHDYKYFLYEGQICIRSVK